MSDQFRAYELIDGYVKVFREQFQLLDRRFGITCFPMGHGFQRNVERLCNILLNDAALVSYSS